MKFLGWILRIAIIAIGVGIFLLQSQYAKKSILEFIVNQPLKDSALRVEVDGIRGLFPFHFSVASLELKEGKHRLAQLSHVSAIWSVPALMSRKIRFELAKEEALAGNLTYIIGKHALFVNLKGKGVALGKKGALLSVDIELPSLDLLEGHITANLHDGVHPVILTVKLEETPDANIHVQDILLTGKNVKGTGHGVIYTKQGAWEGTADLSIDDLAPYNIWVDKHIAGSATLTCQKIFKNHGNLNLQLEGFRYGEFNAQSLKSIISIEEDSHFKGSIQANDVVFNKIPLTTLLVTGGFEEGQGTFNFKGAGNHNISFQSQGTFELPTLQFSQTQVTFNRLELNHPVHQFKLTQPATLVWSEGDVQTSKIGIATQGGMVKIQDLTVGNHLSGDILVDRLPMTLLRIIDPSLVASGYLSGKGRLRGTREKPDAELSLEGKSLQWGKRVKSHRGLPDRFIGIDLKSTFALSGGFLIWQVKCMSGRLFTLTSQGTLSIDPWIPTAESLIEASLKGQGDMGIISLFMPNGDLIKGQISLDLSAKGRVKSPLIQGHISLAKGLYENAAFGTYIKNIKLQGTASGNVLTLSQITGQDNSKGYVSGQGVIKFTSLFNPDVDFQLKLNEMIVVQNDEISEKASGSLRLHGSFIGEDQTKARITGDIVVRPLEIRLDEHSEKIVTIRLLEKKKNGSYQTTKEYHDHEVLQKGRSFLPLDIKLSSPGQMYLRGFGLDSQWKGEVRVQGTIMDPQLVGEITLVRGKFDLLGKPLKLLEGRVIYTHEPKNDALIDIVGSREIAEVTAMMRVEGHASNPKVTFSSVPSLPQEEILARLLFGKGLESMSVTQSLLLANALSTFKGKSNLNFTDKIRSAFGLDVLEFKERKAMDGDDFQSSSQSVSVGKQITDKVYLSLDQSVSGAGGTSATLQFEVTPSLKIEADVGGDKNTGIGFAWVKKY
ncbi:MAG: translocation/assembly module TamB domain-containing protein [Candidatus Paracaedibacter sp.]